MGFCAVFVRSCAVFEYTGARNLNSLLECPMHRRIFRHIQFIVLLLASVLCFTAADDSSLPAPPVAKKVPKVTEINGRKLVDDYYWLRDKSNPEVKAYLVAENGYSDAVMKPTEGFQKKLYDEMLGRIKET